MEDPQNQVEVTETERRGSLGIGLALSLLLPIALIGASVLIQSENFLFVWIFIGLSQLFYIIPLIVYYHRERRVRTIQGLLIGASIVFLLNASCFGLLVTSFKA